MSHGSVVDEFGLGDLADFARCAVTEQNILHSMEAQQTIAQRGKCISTGAILVEGVDQGVVGQDVVELRLLQGP